MGDYPKVIDNFLSDEGLATVSFIQTNRFPWFLNDSMDFIGDGINQFNHIFYHESTIQSANFIPYMMPIVRKLDVFSLIHMKANLSTIVPEEKRWGQYHIDNNDMRKELVDKVLTAVFYFNDNNGGTQFEETGDIVEAKRNRIVIFRNSMKHRIVRHTEGDYQRIVLNLSFI